MSKKKGGGQTNSTAQGPEKLKELGNDAFSKGQYPKAIEFFTKAIEASGDSNKSLASICFSNRAAVKYELHLYEEAKSDCEESIKTNPGFFKAYFRKAQNCLELDELDEAMEALKKIPKSEMNETYEALQFKVQKEIDQCNVLPKTDSEIIRLNKLIDWLNDGTGAEFSKLKIRYYAKNYRGVHASRHIKVS